MMMLKCSDYAEVWLAYCESVYTYGPNGFTQECPVGRNSNVMGYPFPPSTRVVNSLYLCPPSHSFFPSLSLSLSLSLSPPPIFCILRASLNTIFFSNLAYYGEA